MQSEPYKKQKRRSCVYYKKYKMMVRGDMECLHEVEAEISRWRDILAVEYAQFLRGELILYPTVDLH